MKTLIIVESPGKISTIKKILGKGYEVMASFGHVRDLPKKNSAGKSSLGVDIKNNFEPQYEVLPDKKDVVKKLKSAADHVDTVLLASDPDQEGEAIAFHLATLLNLSGKCRITFNSITKDAILAAIKNPREINCRLVDAQQARRVLDRLVGFKLSPMLWSKVAPGTSAGRVQSVALRIISDREKEIRQFNVKEYWTIHSEFKHENKNYEALLVRFKGKELELLTEEKANQVLKDIEKKMLKVAAFDSKVTERKPYPPFETSSLQQAASGLLNFSSKQAMQLAQKLYEGVPVIGQAEQTGLITYMRTDSTRVSDEGMTAVRAYISNNFDKKYQISARAYSNKGGAQDAHEAVRPTHLEVEARCLSATESEKKLYDLIFKRFVASQMADAKIRSTTITFSIGDYEFEAKGSTIDFDGWTRVYPMQLEEQSIPNIKVGTDLKQEKAFSKKHQTKPPPRYSEASLIGSLKKNGVGRPSTYASIMENISTRGYVEKEGKTFVLTDLGLLVSDFLSSNFSDIVDVKFTAKMENDLDEIKAGTNWRNVVKNFYDPFSSKLTCTTKNAKKAKVNTNIACSVCSKLLGVVYGSKGLFLACTGYPTCKTTRNLPEDFSFLTNMSGYLGNSIELDLAAEAEVCGKECPSCSTGKLIERTSKFGKFLGCNGYPKCKHKESIIVAIIPCPACDGGSIVKKGTKTGKSFYACSNYPDCKKAFNFKPLAETCDTCNSILVTDGKKTGCSDTTCKNYLKDPAFEKKKWKKK